MAPDVEFSPNVLVGPKKQDIRDHQAVFTDILKKMFSLYRKVEVEKDLGSGTSFSGSWVFTEPVAEENPAIITANAVLYEVAAGDTLITIAEEFYGDNLEWRKIYEDNRDIIGDDPGRLEVGMMLRIRR